MPPSPPTNGSDRGASSERATGRHAGVPAFAAGLRAYVATRVPAQDVDDVVQDVLLRWLERAGSLEAAAIEPWLITAARNRATDLLRTRNAARDDCTDALERAADEPEAKGALADLVCCLESMLEALMPDERELLRRIDAGGASQAALAAELGLSDSGLRARVQRARARLRAQFDACCAFERDARGAVIDWRARLGAASPRTTCGGEC